MAKKSPWAVLLCKWKDEDSEPHPPEFYEPLFTQSGTGTQNMVDLFDEMSHGSIDVSDSKVFGWFQFADLTTTDPEAGAKLIGAAKASATAADEEVPLADFDGVVVIMNTSWAGKPDFAFGVQGGMAAAVGPPDSTAVHGSVLAEEMGHGYGLEHSRHEGSTKDYMDSWDFMSVWNGNEATHPAYGHIGPGLNAANMRGQGWLNELRVWRVQSQPPFTSAEGLTTEDVELRPLHRPDLSGNLALDVGAYLVEFRPKQKWDAAFPRSVVLVHEFYGSHSYVMKSTSGKEYLADQGDLFEKGSTANPFHEYVRVELVSIDEPGKTATVRVTCRAPAQPRIPKAAGPLRGVGGPFYVTPSGRIIKMPPCDPLLPILNSLESYWSAEMASGSGLSRELRRSALENIVKVATSELENTQALRVPAPRTKR